MMFNSVIGCFDNTHDSSDTMPSVVDDYLEYEELWFTCLPGIKVAGRLKYNIDFWFKIGAPDLILNTIRLGCVIPFNHLTADLIVSILLTANLH